MTVALLQRPAEYVGLSGDTKPADAVAGSLFTETDTGKVFIADSASAWTELATVEDTHKHDALASLAGTTARTVWTPASGKKPRVMKGVVTCSAAAQVELRSGTAGSGTAFLAFEFGAGDSFPFDLGRGFPAAAGDDVIEVYNPTGGALTISVTLAGAEE